MPSIKEKFAGFLRHLSTPSTSDILEPSVPKSPSVESNACFIQRYLNGESRLKQPDILYGRTGQELPCIKICSMLNEVIAVDTGPDGGLTTVNRGKKKHLTSQDPSLSYIDSEEEPVAPPREMRDVVRIRAMGQTFVVPNHHSTPSKGTTKPIKELTTISEDGSPPASLSSPPSPRMATEQSDYRDIVSKFGVLSLPLQPSIDKRRSVTQIDSPDDVLMSGSTSLVASELTSPADEFNTSIAPSQDPLNDPPKDQTKDSLPVAVDLPSVGANTAVNGQQPEAPLDEEAEVAGIVDWRRPSGIACGAATSLYERHPVTEQVAGTPVADAFAVVARSNNAILTLADGVNWGERAALAARSAIHGCMDYLNRALFTSPTSARHITSSDIFLTLLRSFHAAHSMILQEGGMLTTLTAAVVAQMDQSSSQNLLYSGGYSNSSKFIVCVCNVGDSLAYVYSPKYGVREITHGSHDINAMRDMRDALGALGPVDGQNPELNNLTCSMTVIEEGDIVFLTSDGVSDNFDPVVGKFVVAKKPNKVINTSNGAKPTSVREREPKKSNLPAVEAFQRHELTLLRMEDILRNGLLPPSLDSANHLKAQQLCQDLVDFATRLTAAKRRLLEDNELYVDQDGRTLSPEEQKLRRRKLCERLSLIPGKLDHATVVAYEARIQSIPPPSPPSANVSAPSANESTDHQGTNNESLSEQLQHGLQLHESTI